jgi:hypothetical protein
MSTHRGTCSGCLLRGSEKCRDGGKRARGERLIMADVHAPHSCAAIVHPKKPPYTNRMKTMTVCSSGKLQVH